MIRTFTGKLVDPFNPDPNTIDIIDIAHGLSNICRYGGQCSRFYSVAEHCCYVSDASPEGSKLAALLHDASEAYIGDMIQPLKDSGRLGAFETIEDDLQFIIRSKLSAPCNWNMVNHIDIAIREEEIAALFNPSNPVENKYLPASHDIGFDPETAKTMFLRRYNLLTKKRTA